MKLQQTEPTETTRLLRDTARLAFQTEVIGDITHEELLRQDEKLDSIEFHVRIILINIMVRFYLYFVVVNSPIS